MQCNHCGRETPGTPDGSGSQMAICPACSGKAPAVPATANKPRGRQPKPK